MVSKSLTKGGVEEERNPFMVRIKSPKFTYVTESSNSSPALQRLRLKSRRNKRSKDIDKKLKTESIRISTIDDIATEKMG